MKISLIDPPVPFGRPPKAPLILEYLGAWTRRVMPDAEIEFFDPQFFPFSVEKIDADLVGICGSRIVCLPWAYRVADALRKRGIRVVLGGFNPTALPEEAKAHADAVVLGEAESVWSDVLLDAKKGKLKPFYRGEPLPLENLPLPLRLKGYKFHSLFTARGCSYQCNFCALTWFYGKTIRYRPIDEVVKEVDALPGKFYWNNDSNVWAGNLQRAIDLFTALKGSKKKWLGYGDLRAVQTPLGDKLLKSARESGLISLWLGCDEKFTPGIEKDKEEAIKKIKDHGIDIILGTILGKRTDNSENFEKVIKLSERLGIIAHPFLVVPYPGTTLYKEYEPFLYHKNWEFYNGSHALFEHPQMSAEEREEKFFATAFKLLSLKRIFKHIFEIPFSVFPNTHFTFLMRELPVRRGMKIAYQKWQRENDKGARADERAEKEKCLSDY